MAGFPLMALEELRSVESFMASRTRWVRSTDMLCALCLTLERSRAETASILERGGLCGRCLGFGPSRHGSGSGKLLGLGLSVDMNILKISVAHRCSVQ